MCGEEIEEVEEVIQGKKRRRPEVPLEKLQEEAGVKTRSSQR